MHATVQRQCDTGWSQRLSTKDLRPGAEAMKLTQQGTQCVARTLYRLVWRPRVTLPVWLQRGSLRECVERDYSRENSIQDSGQGSRMLLCTMHAFCSICCPSFPVTSLSDGSIGWRKFHYWVVGRCIHFSWKHSNGIL